RPRPPPAVGDPPVRVRLRHLFAPSDRNTKPSLRVSSVSFRPLMRSATAAAPHAYSPYSRFRVGAAVLADGVQYIGCNIENASYGLTMCAERVALYNGIAAGHHTIDALAVNCLDGDVSEAVGARMPCGACRQVMRELLRPNSPIVVVDIGIFFIDELLPLSFFLQTTYR
ncbi:MAG: cytidine deaminase, partial [Stellaceae bacterium]